MAIKLTFYGAAGCVTGSAYHLQSDRANLLLDFGMFHGHDGVNEVPPGLNLAKLDTVLLTHAHLDHCGRIPFLNRAGYHGPILCTEPTIPLTGLILRDSAHLQALEAERYNRKHNHTDHTTGAPPMQPIYSAEDVEVVLKQLQVAPYEDAIQVAPGIRARWVEAGHMLGSASIQLCIEDGGSTKTVVFSGDVGDKGIPILKDSVGFHKADVVVMESTYGDHDHKPIKETLDEFESLVRQAVERRGKILVPVFAVGRAQLLLYLLAVMFRHRVLPKFPIFLDSPMAIEATRIYWEHISMFDEDFQAFGRERPIIADLDTLKSTPTAEDSKALNDQAGPCMILAGSGMATGGRILHHLARNLGDESACILIVGYQSEGSLGRRLVDGDKEVSIFGETVAVKAQVHTLGGFSAHAGQSELLAWLGKMTSSRPRVFLTHGESRGREPLANLIQQKFSIVPELPNLGLSAIL